MPITSEKSNDYSKLIVFVCNIPEEKYASEREQSIIKGLKKKWSESQNDPDCERLHIIYLDRNDNPIAKKFAPLNRLDRKTKLWMVGHCKPGSDVIRSDKVYLSKDKTKYERHGFSFVDLGLILLANIRDPSVLVERDAAIHNVRSSLRKFKVVVPGCYAADDERNLLGNVVEKSFVYKLFQFLYNMNKQVLVADIVGANGLVFPMASKSDLANSLKFIMDSKDFESSFHKRYMQPPFRKGTINLNFFVSGLAHQKGDDYKLTFVPAADVTQDDIDNQSVSYKVLNVPQAKTRMKMQCDAEIAMQILSSILSNNDLSRLHKSASELLFSIETGKVTGDKIALFMDIIIKEMSISMSSKVCSATSDVSLVATGLTSNVGSVATDTISDVSPTINDVTGDVSTACMRKVS